MNGKLTSKKFLGFFVDFLYNLNVSRLQTQLSGDFDSEKFNDLINCFMPQHHFLMVALYLVGVSGLDEFGQVSENLDSLALGLGVKYVSKIC